MRKPNPEASNDNIPEYVRLMQLRRAKTLRDRFVGYTDILFLSEEDVFTDIELVFRKRAV